jgi:hypothetical protein
MENDNLEQEGLVHRESGGEPSMIAAFCQTKRAWSHKDH